MVGRPQPSGPAVGQSTCEDTAGRARDTLALKTALANVFFPPGVPSCLQAPGHLLVAEMLAFEPLTLHP